MKEEKNEYINALEQTQNKNEIAQVLRELFNPNKRRMITEASQDELKLMVRMELLSEMWDIKPMKKLVHNYQEGMISHKRQGRKEILEAVKGSTKKKNLLSRINPFNTKESD